MKRWWPILGVMLIAVVGPLSAAEESQLQDDSERVYSLPLSEAEEIIAGWLETNGFAFSRSFADHRHVQLVAEKAGFSRQIDLAPQSPLATRISVSPRQTSTDFFLSGFWDYIDEYVQTPNAVFNSAAAAVPSLVRDRVSAVACVYSHSKGKEVQLTGFVIDRKGVLVSTAHDLEIGQQVTVRFHDGLEKQGRVFELDGYRDLCLIQVAGSVETMISLNDGRYALNGDDALFVLQCPGSGVDGIQSGALAGLPRRVAGLPLWQAKIHIEPGSSGSPVFDAQGRLAAVVKGRYRGTNSVGFLIPLETLLNFIDKN